MLSIIFGDAENSVFNTDAYFDNTYEDEWITSDDSIQIIKDIDKSEIKGPNLIDSPFLGPISTDRLSRGTKTLILLLHDNSGKIFNASTCGDNCAKWILDIADKKDITIMLYHNLNFGNNFKAKIVNTGEIVESMAEMIHASKKFI